MEMSQETLKFIPFLGITVDLTMEMRTAQHSIPLNPQPMITGTDRVTEYRLLPAIELLDRPFCPLRC
jgi:hypothetical protein